jgi:predicted PurR-regulated permease PerM
MFTVPERTNSRALVDALIRMTWILVLAWYCARVFGPFLELTLWSVILAVALAPAHRWLSARLGGRAAWSAVILVLLGFVFLIAPVYLLAASTIDTVQSLSATVQRGDFHIPPPPPRVAQWPLVGARLFDFWTRAASDLNAFMQPFLPRIRHVSRDALGMLASLGLAVLMFMGALVIAGIVLVRSAAASLAARRIGVRLLGPQRGPEVVVLCAATVRTVVQGVVGIAFIQMLLVGAGMLVMGIPGAGPLAMVVLLLGVMQVPVSLITLPVVIFAFHRDGAGVGTIVFTVYMLLAGLSDNVLKPLMLGRGVDVPMPVILIGALGGMVVNGVIGLFIGAVALAVGYRLFWFWVDEQVPRDLPPPAPRAEMPDAP